MRVEHEYERGGALQYLAAWDVRRGRVLGRCEDKTGIDSFVSIIQRKVLTPNVFASLEEVEQRLRLYEELSNREPRPFEWKFDRAALLKFLARLEAKHKLVS
jgi:hypothetical protein